MSCHKHLKLVRTGLLQPLLRNRQRPTQPVADVPSHAVDPPADAQARDAALLVRLDPVPVSLAALYGLLRVVHLNRSVQPCGNRQPRERRGTDGARIWTPPRCPPESVGTALRKPTRLPLHQTRRRQPLENPRETDSCVSTSIRRRVRDSVEWSGDASVTSKVQERPQAQRISHRHAIPRSEEVNRCDRRKRRNNGKSDTLDAEAFGYGPPHPGAGGTSTLLTSALPGAHYGPVRLPTSARSARFSHPSRRTPGGDHSDGPRSGLPVPDADLSDLRGTGSSVSRTWRPPRTRTHPQVLLKRPTTKSPIPAIKTKVPTFLLGNGPQAGLMNATPAHTNATNEIVTNSARTAIRRQHSHEQHHEKSHTPGDQRDSCLHSPLPPINERPRRLFGRRTTHERVRLFFVDDSLPYSWAPFARGSVSPVAISEGQQASQHVPASFQRPPNLVTAPNTFALLPVKARSRLDIGGAFWYGAVGREVDLRWL